MATSSDRILVVDDDTEIRRLLQQYLEKNGYVTTTAADAGGMWQALRRGGTDLIVLDLMLPDSDGLSVCRDLRSPHGPAPRNDIPVVMLTARGESTDRIIGLEMGADDYLAKPFEPRELLARIRSVLRRMRTLPPGSERPSRARRLQFGGWTLDTVARHLVSPEGVVRVLSGAEYRLLRALLENPRRVLSRDELLDAAYGHGITPFNRV